MLGVKVIKKEVIQTKRGTHYSTIFVSFRISIVLIF